MSARKPATPPAVAEAKRKATIPTRPVIERTKLFRASLLVERQAAADELAAIDTEIQAEIGIRDAAIEAANRAYDIALEAAHHAREGAHAVAVERCTVIQRELGEARADNIRTTDGIDAALAATEAKPSNVEPIRSDVEMAA